MYPGDVFPGFVCLFAFFDFLDFFVVAEIFTVLVMLMPNVTKLNLLRPQSCMKFCVSEPTPFMALQ